jgi:DNA-binding transcriptional LysR family regulator
VSLTGAGHALAARAGEVLDVLAAARADLDRLSGSLGGPVELAAVASAALTFVSAAAREVSRTHPDIELGVTAAEPSDALAMLLAGDVDLAVVDEYDYVPLAFPDFVIARPLRTDPLVVTVAPGWPGKRRPALRDLAGERWVMPPEHAACGQAVRSACRAAGFEPDVRWTSDDMLVLAQAVSDRHGIAVLPRLSVAHDGVRVEMRALREPRLARRLTALSRASALGRPSVGAVLDALAAAAR